MHSSDKDREPYTSPEGLCDVLIWMSDRRKRKDLEAFRIEYEKEHGPTDLTKRYTSLFPSEQQTWLWEHHTKRYWDGLPPFLQAYLRRNMEAAHRDGKLDDMPAGLLRLYLQKEMNIGGDGPSR